MSSREVALSDITGRKVHDRDGRYIGRLVELEARIALRDGRSEYVVDNYRISHFGTFDWLAGSKLVQQLVERLGKTVGYRCEKYPAHALDLTDPRRPTVKGP